MAKTNRKQRHPLVRWAQANSRSITNVADELGVSRTCIHYWETGFRVPRRFTLQMIVDYTKGAVTANDCHQYWLALQEKRT